MLAPDRISARFHTSSVVSGPIREPAPSVQLSRNKLFISLPERDAGTLVAKGKIVELSKGQLLFQTGERIDNVYFPLSGLISLVAALPNGKSIEVASVGRDGALGIGVALGLETAITQAVVQIRGQALRVPARTLAAIAEASKPLRSLAALYHGTLAAQLVDTVACTAFHDSQARLCRYLVRARDCVGSTTLPLTQEMISEALGVRRTTVTFIAGTLQSKGIISYQRGELEICDEAALEKLACYESNGASRNNS